jgi:hypothetical protein
MPNISKELLNKNRVLTMSNNRKCDYLIVDVGKEFTTIMGINAQGNTKDIIIIKTLYNKNYNQLVDEVYWLCKEHNTKIVLSDCLGYGLGFIDAFKMHINQSIISIREINGREILNNNILDILYEDLQNGVLRFLQTPEIANTFYNKSFLGYSSIMQYHKETDKLIDEINNIEIKYFNGRREIGRMDTDTNKSGVMCLLLYYSYPFSSINNNKDSKNNEKEYEIVKRMSQYEIIHGVFYKYLFKCIENDGINVLFYCNIKNKIEQFKNITQEVKFKDIFSKNIKDLKIWKDGLEIIFFNNSYIKFVLAGNGSRGCKCHYAVVDSDIKKDYCNDVIIPACVLFEMDKENKKLKDIYNVEFIEM